MKRGPKPKIVTTEDEITDDEEYEILHGVKAVCTCVEDPRWCPKHMF